MFLLFSSLIICHPGHHHDHGHHHHHHDDDDDEIEFKGANFTRSDDFDSPYYYESEYDPKKYHEVDENGNLICGNNTFVDKYGCHCNDSYIGDPYDKVEGCYKCNKECSSYASCVYPGNCECYRDYTGDGQKCIQNQPSLNFISRENKTHLMVRIIYASDDELTDAFCKFDETVVHAHSFDQNHISCVIPNTALPNTLVSVSKDGKGWSTETVLHGYTEDNTDKSKNKIYVMIFIVLMVVLTFILSNTKSPQQIKKEPFALQHPRPRRQYIP